MKLSIKVIVFRILCLTTVFFAIVRITYASATIVNLHDDEFRVLPIESPLNILANDTIQNLPKFGWIFEIGQNPQQGAKFSYFESHLLLVEPKPGRYEFTYILRWPEGRDEAKVFVTILNSDGTDPPLPNPPLYIPFLKTE